MTKYIRLIIIVGIFALIASLTYTCKRLEKSQAEVSRLSENAKQKLHADSLKFSSEILKRAEFEEYLEYQNKELKRLLAKEKINTRKVERVIITETEYIDRDTSIVNLDSIKKSILANLPTKQNFELIDSCSTIKGHVGFDGTVLDLKITEKQFNNKIDVVLYKQRRQWKFLGIKTRLFGKREVTARVFDQCGQSSTQEIVVK
ncbi:hypothetical protein K5I29_04320 [Flavobacterium agricola]|uniref:Uncharacterized protein n=1 Tax=Flavobacterium agricola TaxID=2870839 RepID=A0ABY6M1K9_9FLAO|nr:hypothetical protein [Flavobacterium agricola]UYW02132.1 hypothetical protein K5I29_04320 [Flavobacterium agricola]